VTAAGALLLLAVGLTGQVLYFRPDVRARLRAALYVPLCRRWRCARRSLAALTRAALLKPYRGHHTPANRRVQP
jgi:hypothetical protein